MTELQILSPHGLNFYVKYSGPKHLCCVSQIQKVTKQDTFALKKKHFNSAHLGCYNAGSPGAVVPQWIWNSKIVFSIDSIRHNCDKW